MILVKCKCGCHFTIKDETLPEMQEYRCINCHNKTTVSKDADNPTSLTDLSEQGLELYRIPDDFEIRFSF